MSLECKKCYETLVELPVCSDRDDFRHDMYCLGCDTRYGVRSHGLETLSEGVKYAKVNKKNRELRITISTLADELTRTQKRIAGYKKLISALKNK